MGWFSHRRRSGGRYNCNTYLRAPRTASEKKCRTRTAPQRATPEQNAAHFRFFCPRWPWPLTLTFDVGQDFCTVHLTAKFRHPVINRSEIIVLTNKETDKQTPLKSSTSLQFW